MITSNAGAEFTTKTTIIVVLPGLQGENTLVRLGEMVVLRCNKQVRFGADSRCRSPKPDRRLCENTEIRRAL